MSRRTMTWDSDADQHLLLAILSTHTIKLDHEVVAKRLGPPCTKRAVEERLKKLRRMAKERGFGLNDGDTSPTEGRTLKPATKRAKVDGEGSKVKKVTKAKPKPLKAERAKKRTRAESEEEEEHSVEDLEPEHQEDEHPIEGDKEDIEEEVPGDSADE